ncbi:hypothetical protein EON65_39540 [archaeon]|nr:MAG: hypothetical protein EON65_39540 [archaeon]
MSRAILPVTDLLQMGAGDEGDNFKISPVQKSYLPFNALKFDILFEDDCVILQLRDRDGK